LLDLVRSTMRSPSIPVVRVPADTSCHFHAADCQRLNDLLRSRLASFSLLKHVLGISSPGSELEGMRFQTQIMPCSLTRCYNCSRDCKLNPEASYGHVISPCPPLYLRRALVDLTANYKGWLARKYEFVVFLFVQDIVSSYPIQSFLDLQSVQIQKTFMP